MEPPKLSLPGERLGARRPEASAREVLGQPGREPGRRAGQGSRLCSRRQANFTHHAACTGGGTCDCLFSLGVHV